MAKTAKPTCPCCGALLNLAALRTLPPAQIRSLIGALSGSLTSKRKARAARRNAKLGGWPKGKPRQPRIANTEPLGIIDGAETALARQLTKSATNPLAHEKAQQQKTSSQAGRRSH